MPRTLVTISGAGAAGGAGGGGGGGGSTLVNLGTISAPVTVTGPAVSAGALLSVYGVMDATGHAVSWDAAFQWPPDIDTTPSVGFAALFVGVGTSWVLVAMPVVGVHV